MKHNTLKELKEAIQSAGTFVSTRAYGMPAFRYKTKIVACYMDCKEHIGYYPYSSRITPQFKAQLKSFKTSVGAVQFPKGDAIPKALLKRMVRARMKEIDAQIAQKPKKK